MRSISKEGFIFEQGPRSIRNNHMVVEVLNMADELGILHKCKSV